MVIPRKMERVFKLTLFILYLNDKSDSVIYNVKNKIVI